MSNGNLTGADITGITSSPLCVGDLNSVSKLELVVVAHCHLLEAVV